MKTPLLTAKNITKTFDGHTNVLNGISLEINEEDFTVIMGASGSGKSTLLYALSGMDTVSGGQIFYRDEDMTHLGEKRMTALRANDFGFVFQKTHLVSNLSLYENIVVAGFNGAVLSQSEAQERANTLIKQMNLTEAKKRLPSEVSGGEAQRAAVARAVISKPKILFADEPTGALNKANTDEVLELFSSLYANGQSVLLVTHDKQAALRGNRILYLEDGRIVDELELDPYDGKDKKREDCLSDWLNSQRW